MKVSDVVYANMGRKIRIWDQYGWCQCSGKCHTESYGFDEEKDLDVLEYEDDGEMITIRIRSPK